MRVLLSIALFVNLSLTTIGQTNQIDSLISKLNNSEIKPGGNYFGPTFHLEHGAGTELLKLGKYATQGLLDILSDSTKGVIAHYILTSLWKDTIPWVNPIYIEKDKITAYTYNELTFFIKGTEVYANQSAIKTNELIWKAFLKGKITSSR